jgi:hypothetical protein
MGAIVLWQVSMDAHHAHRSWPVHNAGRVDGNCKGAPAAIAPTPTRCPPCLQHYFEYPFVTRMHSEVGFFTFPAVTICNTNPVKLSKVGNILDPLYVDKLDGHYTLNYSVNNMIDPFAQARYDFEAVCCKYPEMRTFLEQTISAYNYLQRVSLGHTLQDLVLFCAYNGRQCDFDK